jgi:hypothetical protein
MDVLKFVMSTVQSINMSHEPESLVLCILLIKWSTRAIRLGQIKLTSLLDVYYEWDIPSTLAMLLCTPQA